MSKTKKILAAITNEASQYLNTPFEMTKEILEEKLWDHYSELPNPLWYEQPIQTDINVDDIIKPEPEPKNDSKL